MERSEQSEDLFPFIDKKKKNELSGVCVASGEDLYEIRRINQQITL